MLYIVDNNDFFPLMNADDPTLSGATLDTSYSVEWYDVILPYVSTAVKANPEKGTGNTVYSFLICRPTVAPPPFFPAARTSTAPTPTTRVSCARKPPASNVSPLPR